MRGMHTNANQFLLDLEQREKLATRIASLKVAYNRVHGYYIEVSRSHADRVPEHYTRRQTLKNTERYITAELKRFEDEVLSSRERALKREKFLYEQLLDELIEELDTLRSCALGLSQLDALVTLAERALTLNYVRPQFTDENRIDIRQGRHPVIEQVQE